MLQPADVRVRCAHNLQDDGFVAKILVGEGEKDIAVGTPLLVLVEDEDSIGSFKDYSPGQDKSGGGAQTAESGAQPQEEHAPEAASSGDALSL